MFLLCVLATAVATATSLCIFEWEPIFGKGMADEALFSEKKGLQWKGGRHSMCGGYPYQFLRERKFSEGSGPFGEPPNSENWKVAVLIPFPKANPSHMIQGVSKCGFAYGSKLSCKVVFFDGLLPGRNLLVRACCGVIVLFE